MVVQGEFLELRYAIYMLKIYHLTIIVLSKEEGFVRSSATNVKLADITHDL